MAVHTRLLHPLILVVLLGLLMVLGTLQYVWIGRLSQAERERLQAGLDEAVSRFTEGFDRELIRVAVTFAPVEYRVRDNLEGWLGDRMEWWRAEAPFPGMVDDLLLVRREAGVLEVSRYVGQDEAFFSCELPVGFESLQGAMIAGQPLPPLPDGVTALVLPPRHRGEPRDPVPLYVVVELNLDYIRTTVLPRLGEGSLGTAAGWEFAAVVVVRERPGEVLFRFGDTGGVAPGKAADVTREFFPGRPLTPPAWRGRMVMDRGGGEPGLRDRDGETALPGRTPAAVREDGGTDSGHPNPQGRWLLLASHRTGSLATAVSQMRHRNLAIGLSVLGLLAASALLLAVSSQRAQRLARQRLQFVAGVSHELRTPLTAITSAGQNLADGVVSEPGQVRRYGAMIQQEGRRLAQMVGRVLDFAGIHSGQRAYALGPVTVPQVVAGVLEDARLALESKGFHVETDLPPDLPTLLADGDALREALSNLLDNAIKFSGQFRWIGISARAEAGPRGPVVAITVADHGLGIPREDLPHLFQPFVRGSGPAASVPGSGLGLSLVAHVVDGHAGVIAVDTEVGVGTRVTLRLPVAPPPGAQP